MFKKLFEVEYNNKRFLILYDENRRYTFLESSQEGMYQYPQYEDYKALHNLLNNYDYAIKYETENKSYRYTEKVNWRGMLLTVLATTTIIGSVTGLTIRPNKRMIEIITSSAKKPIYNNIEKISEYFEGTITKEEVLNAIDNNQNMDPYYKRLARDTMELIQMKDPNLDLRIYYENMKDITIRIIPKYDPQYLREGLAWFDPYKCEICIKEGYESEEDIVRQELGHAAHNLAIVKDGKVIIISDTRGVVLEEAMTSTLVDDDEHYEKSQKLLYFLMQCVNNFDYAKYNQSGIVSLIDELKELYPDVDIDYIVSYLDTAYLCKKTGIKIVPFQSKKTLCTELIKLAVESRGKTRRLSLQISELLDDELTEADKKELFQEYQKYAKQKGIPCITSYTLFKLNYIDNRDKIIGSIDCPTTYEEQEEIFNQIVDEIVANITKDNLYDDYSEFVEALSHSKYLHDNPVTGLPVDDYLAIYDMKAVDLGFLTYEQAMKIRNIEAIVKSSREINMFYTIGDYTLYNRGFILPSGQKISCVMADQASEPQYVTFTDEPLEVAWLYENDHNRLLKEASRHPEDEYYIFSQEAIKKYVDEQQLFDNHDYNYTQNGDKLFDGITNDMVVEVGLTENNELGFILKDSQKVYYQTCDKFISPSNTVPYTLYIKMGDNETATSIEYLLSKKYFESIELRILRHYFPNLKIENLSGNFYQPQYTYQVRELPTIKIEGKKIDARSIFIYFIDFGHEDINFDSAYFHYPDEEDTFLGERQDLSIKPIKEEPYLLIYIDEILASQGIKPTNLNEYDMTYDELIEVVEDYAYGRHSHSKTN